MSVPICGAVTRRDALTTISAAALAGLAGPAGATAPTQFQLARFTADVTPPRAHPLLAGLCPPAAAIEDPLYAKGVVLLGGERPIVLVSIDWCEIRNRAYDDWRDALARAAGTDRQHVLVTCIHQHDAPLGDLGAERVLRERGLEAHVVDPEYHQRCVEQTAAALAKSLASARPVTHLGTGQARVEKVASNRRFLNPDGTPNFGRGSATTDEYARSQPEGTIDPRLKTLSFWHDDQPLAAISAYATHPMSYYRTGRVSYDFPGIARERRGDALPDVHQIYCSGASGNVTAGKYNDGSPANRQVLAQRLFDAMTRAWEATQPRPLERIALRQTSFELAPRTSAGFTRQDLDRRLQPGGDQRDQSLAALAWSWLDRAESGQPIDLPVIDFGPARFVLLPGESYVEYQLLAQQLAGDAFVMVAGYGECAPGYIPTEKHWQENDGNLRDWCWVDPGAEPVMRRALERVLGPA